MGYKFVGSMLSLNRSIVWASQYSCLSFSLLSSTITSIPYSSTCLEYMGNMFMFPTWKISLVVPVKILTLPWVIYVSCSLFKDIYTLFVHPDPYHFHLWDHLMYIFPHLFYQLLMWQVEGFGAFLFAKCRMISTSCRRRPRVSKIVP